jgi:anti-sigma-K factor RskA
MKRSIVTVVAALVLAVNAAPALAAQDTADTPGILATIAAFMASINVHGKQHKALVHFDRNGFGYTIG